MTDRPNLPSLGPPPTAALPPIPSGQPPANRGNSAAARETAHSGPRLLNEDERRELEELREFHQLQLRARQRGLAELQELERERQERERESLRIRAHPSGASHPFGSHSFLQPRATSQPGTGLAAPAPTLRRKPSWNSGQRRGLNVQLSTDHRVREFTRPEEVLSDVMSEREEADEAGDVVEMLQVAADGTGTRTVEASDGNTGLGSESASGSEAALTDSTLLPPPSLASFRTPPSLSASPATYLDGLERQLLCGGSHIQTKTQAEPHENGHHTQEMDQADEFAREFDESFHSHEYDSDNAPYLPSVPSAYPASVTSEPSLPSAPTHAPQTRALAVPLSQPAALHAGHTPRTRRAPPPPIQIPTREPQPRQPQQPQQHKIEPNGAYSWGAKKYMVGEAATRSPMASPPKGASRSIPLTPEAVRSATPAAGPAATSATTSVTAAQLARTAVETPDPITPATATTAAGATVEWQRNTRSRTSYPGHQQSLSEDLTYTHGTPATLYELPPSHQHPPPAADADANPPPAHTSHGHYYTHAAEPAADRTRSYTPNPAHTSEHSPAYTHTHTHTRHGTHTADTHHPSAAHHPPGWALPTPTLAQFLAAPRSYVHKVGDDVVVLFDPSSWDDQGRQTLAAVVGCMRGDRKFGGGRQGRGGRGAGGEGIAKSREALGTRETELRGQREARDEGRIVKETEGTAGNRDTQLEDESIKDLYVDIDEEPAPAPGPAAAPAPAPALVTAPSHSAPLVGDVLGTNIRSLVPVTASSNPSGPSGTSGTSGRHTSAAPYSAALTPFAPLAPPAEDIASLQERKRRGDTLSPYELDRLAEGQAAILAAKEAELAELAAYKAQMERRRNEKERGERKEGKERTERKERKERQERQERREPAERYDRYNGPRVLTVPLPTPSTSGPPSSPIGNSGSEGHNGPSSTVSPATPAPTPPPKDPRKRAGTLRRTMSVTAGIKAHAQAAKGAKENGTWYAPVSRSRAPVTAAFVAGPATIHGTGHGRTLAHSRSRSGLSLLFNPHPKPARDAPLAECKAWLAAWEEGYREHLAIKEGVTASLEELKKEREALLAWYQDRKEEARKREKRQRKAEKEGRRGESRDRRAKDGGTGAANATGNPKAPHQSNGHPAGIPNLTPDYVPLHPNANAAGNGNGIGTAATRQSKHPPGIPNLTPNYVPPRDPNPTPRSVSPTKTFPDGTSESMTLLESRMASAEDVAAAWHRDRANGTTGVSFSRAATHARSRSRLGVTKENPEDDMTDEESKTHALFKKLASRGRRNSAYVKDDEERYGRPRKRSLAESISSLKDGLKEAVADGLKGVKGVVDEVKDAGASAAKSAKSVGKSVGRSMRSRNKSRVSVRDGLFGVSDERYGPRRRGRPTDGRHIERR